MNLITLVDDFHSEDACRDYLATLRWPEGVRCVRCNSDTVGKIETRDLFQCRACLHQFSVTAGTVLHDSHLPLWKWFLATYLMCESKKGISANQLKRTIKVSYKTAWYLSHRIRSAMGSVESEPLTGVVEVDEAYIGGKSHRGRRGPRADKAIVLGAMQRGGNIRLRVAAANDRKTLHAFIRSEVADDAEAIYTDSYAPYKGIADANTRHETVNHRKEEWVRGDVHTNTAESAWSLLKRSIIIGSYHHVNAWHLPAYLSEVEWKFNNRYNDFLFRDTLTALLSAETLTYEKLVSS